MTRLVVGAVGGVGLVHESDFELRTEPWMVERWTGSREVEEPVVVHHTLGDAPLTDARLVYDGAPWNRYFIDSAGRQLVHFAEAGQQCPEQVLVAVRPGYRYELLYREVPSVPVMQSARDLPIVTLALAARGNALVVHACAFLARSGQGVLCPGVSGSGKSTLARLLAKMAPPIETLSDDRVVLTDRAGELRIWVRRGPATPLPRTKETPPCVALFFSAAESKGGCTRSHPQTPPDDYSPWSACPIGTLMLWNRDWR
jgi:hypothetical protein